MRVLVVEDEAALAEGVRRGLEAEGFATDVAATASTGCGWRREHPYDAIVLDILLPGMNGYKVCAAAARRGVWTPILMLTAKDGEFDEAEALDTGADDYVTKPFSYVALVARLRALIRRGVAERPAVLAAGDLRLDPGRAPRVAGRRRAHRSPRASWRCSSSSCGAAARSAPRPTSSTTCGTASFDGDLNIVEVYIGHLRAQARPAVRAHGDRDGPRRRLPIGGRRWMTASAGSGSA